MTLILKRFFIFWLVLLAPFGQTEAAWQQPPEQFPAFGSAIGMHSDANGNAIAVCDNAGDVEAFFYTQTTNTWSGPTLLGASNGNLAMDMDGSGTALAVWVDQTTGTDLHSSFFNGVSWATASPDPFATSGSISEINLTLNGPNTALATWFDSTTGTVFSSFFSAGTWGSTIPVSGPGVTGPLSSDYSANGSAVASYLNGTTLQVSNFISGSWQLLPGSSLDPSIALTSHNAIARIDANGNAAVVWVQTPFGSVKASSFNGTSWLPSVMISLVTLNSPISLSFDMAPNGTGVAAWVELVTKIGYSNSYNGTTWGTVQNFPNPASDTSRTDISVNVHGDALLLFQTPFSGPSTGVVFSARLPLNGVWSGPDFIYIPLFPITFLISSLSDNGIGFAAWATGLAGFGYFASVDIPLVSPVAPEPPASITGNVCKQKFATYTDYIHIITWTPSPTSTVVAYEIRRNGTLIGETPGLIFIDHHRCQTDTYSVAAIDINGLVSQPIVVVIP